MQNLDRLGAEYGSNIAKNVRSKLGNYKAAETLITKALGVLQEQGLYALGLFCESRGNDEKGGAIEILNQAAKMLEKELEPIIDDKDTKQNDNFCQSKFFKLIDKINGLDNLMLAAKVMEKALIYARYRAKAMKKIENESITNSLKSRKKEGE